MQRQNNFLPCDNCKLPVRVQKYKLEGKYKHKHHFCNLQCRYQWQKTALLGINNPFSGKKHTETSREKMRLGLKGRVPWNTGLTLSKEHRLKFSLSKIAYFQTHPEAKAHLRAIQLGSKQPPETIEKRVAHLRGRKRPQWVVERIRATVRRGPQNHFWRGGMSTISYRLRRCSKFVAWRKEVFARDDYTCQECGVRGSELHPHHLTSFSEILFRLYRRYGRANLYEKALRSRILWDVNNGQTLCANCHRKTDSYGKNLPKPLPV